MTLCERVYAIVRTFPQEERYALGDQLRRAVISIPSNIAEGNGRDSRTEYARFLAIARGSVSEVQTQLELVQRLSLSVVSADTYNLTSRVSKMLFSMIRKLRADPSSQSPIPIPHSPTSNPHSPKK